MTAQPRFSAAQLSHALVEATDSLICVVDGEGRILLANAALERFTGGRRPTCSTASCGTCWSSPRRCTSPGRPSPPRWRAST